MPRDAFAEMGIKPGAAKRKPIDAFQKIGIKVPTQGRNISVPGTPLDMLKQAIPEFYKATTGVGPLLGQANLLGRIAGIKQLQQPSYEEKTPGQQFGELGGIAASVLVPTVAGSKAGLATKALEDIRNIRPDRLEKAATTIIGAETRLQQKASKLFGEGLDKIAQANPTKTVDITDAMNTVRIERDFDPVINSIANAKGQLSNMLKGSGGEMTIKDAQEALRQLQGIAKRAQPGDPRFHTLRTVIDDIKGAIAESFPEYKEIAKKYKEMTKPLRVVRKKITQGAKGDPSMLSADLENKMAKNWNQNSVVRQKLRQITTKQEWAELEKIRKEQGIVAWIRKIARLD